MPFPSPWLRMFVRCFALQGLTGRSSGRAFSSKIMPGINFLLWADEESSARLNVIQRVSRARSGFHRNHHATISALEFTLEGRVFLEEMAHQTLAASQIDQIAFETDQATGRNNRFH